MHLDLPQLLSCVEMVALALTKIPEIEQCKCIEWFARCLHTGRGGPNIRECSEHVDQRMRDRVGSTPLMYAASVANSMTAQGIVNSAICDISVVNQTSHIGATALHMVCADVRPANGRETEKHLCDSLRILRALLSLMHPDMIRARTTYGHTAFSSLVINRPRLALFHRAAAIEEFLARVPDAFSDLVPIRGHDTPVTVALRAAASNPAMLWDQRNDRLRDGIDGRDVDPAGVSIVDYVLGAVHTDYRDRDIRVKVAGALRPEATMAPDDDACRWRYAACYTKRSMYRSGDILDRSIAILTHMHPMFGDVSPYAAGRVFDS